MTAHPFGTNIITLALVYKDQLKLVCDLECEFIVFAGGILKKNEIQQTKKPELKLNRLKALLMTPNPS